MTEVLWGRNSSWPDSGFLFRTPAAGNVVPDLRANVPQLHDLATLVESLAAVASFPSDAAAALQDADARLAAKVG